MQVEYTITCEPELEPIAGNAMASGDETVDRETEAWIIDQLERGNEWAWCIVKVTASVELDGERFEGADYLGCCSYDSEADFVGDGNTGYFPDMKAAALADLEKTLERARDRGQTAALVRKHLQEA